MKLTLWSVAILSLIWMFSILIVILNPGLIFGPFSFVLIVVGAVVISIIIEIFEQ